MSRKRAKLKLSSSFSHGVDDPENTHHHQPLIPGLPDHIAHLILSKLPPSLLFSVCLPWRKLIYSSIFPPFLSLYCILTPISHSQSQSIVFSSFDPISGRWQWLPKPPLDLLLRHPSFISRNLPIQSVAAAGRLVVVAATSERLLPALDRPMVFDPAEGKWGFGPCVAVPRRWCASGSVKGAVYVAGGVGNHFSAETARTAERWDVAGGGRGWERVAPLRDGRFAREAVGGVGWRGRLFMVNVDAKEGAVYDATAEEWLEMAEGMVAGWRGPAADMAEEDVFLVDAIKGVLRKYHENTDSWVDVAESDHFKGTHHIAAAVGKVCVVAGGGGGIVVVDVAAAPVRMWVVEPPEGYEAVAVHVLPRMSSPEFGVHSPGGG